MICLDDTDLIEGDADNATEVDYTIHGLIGSTFTQLAAGQLPNAKGTLYTAGAATSVVCITLVNTGAAAQSVNLYLDPAAGANSRRMIPKDVSLGIGYSLHFDGQRCTVMNASGGTVMTTLTTIATDPIWAAAGDLVQGTANDTAAKLAIGTVGQIPTVNVGATALAYEGGAWTTPIFNAGDFTASAGMTWTVEAADVVTYAYLIVGKTMYLNVWIGDTTVGGVLSFGLIVKVPGGKTLAKSMYIAAKISDNGAGGIGYMRGDAAGTTMQINKANDANWAAAVNTTTVGFSVSFEIQ